MLTSESIAAIMPAFIKAQRDFKPAVKDAVNGQFAKGTNPKPSYVTLAQSIESVTPALNANGIALFQQTDVTEGGGTILITRLIHESGEWIAGRYVRCRAGSSEIVRSRTKSQWTVRCRAGSSEKSVRIW